MLLRALRSRRRRGSRRWKLSRNRRRGCRAFLRTLISCTRRRPVSFWRKPRSSWLCWRIRPSTSWAPPRRRSPTKGRSICPRRQRVRRRWRTLWRRSPRRLMISRSCLDWGTSMLACRMVWIIMCFCMVEFVGSMLREVMIPWYKFVCWKYALIVVTRVVWLNCAKVLNRITYKGPG